jgi:hypothetical protein
VEVGVVVVWWGGEDNNNARARAGKSRKTPLFGCFPFVFVLFFVFGLICLFVSVYVYVSVLCFCIYLFVHCTQYFLELFQKTDPAMGSSVKSRESHVRQPSAE